MYVHHNELGSTFQIQVCLSIQTSINVIHTIDRTKDKHHTLILIGAKGDETALIFLINMTNMVRIEYMMKNTQVQSRADVLFMLWYGTVFS